MYFTDDIILLSTEIQQAKQLLHRVKPECDKLSLVLKVKKTKDMFFNVGIEPITTIARNIVGQALNDSKEQDF